MSETIGTAIDINRWVKGAAPSAQDIEDMNALLQELAAPDDPESNLTRENFVRHMSFVNATLIIARDTATGHIVGMVSLHEKHLLGIGFMGDVEEFVVKEEYRGLGITDALDDALRATALERGIKFLCLTSAPWRITANKFYRRRGWVHYATNNYWLVLD